MKSCSVFKVLCKHTGTSTRRVAASSCRKLARARLCTGGDRGTTCGARQSAAKIHQPVPRRLGINHWPHRASDSRRRSGNRQHHGPRSRPKRRDPSRAHARAQHAHFLRTAHNHSRGGSAPGRLPCLHRADLQSMSATCSPVSSWSERPTLDHSNWIFRSIYDLARFSTVVVKFMHTVKTSFSTTERPGGVAFETTSFLASPGPLGVVTMGTFPLSLIAFGWTRRQSFDHALASRSKSDQWKADLKRGSQPSLS